MGSPGTFGGQVMRAFDKFDYGKRVHARLPGMKHTGTLAERTLGRGRGWYANPWMVMQRAGHHMAPGSIGQIGGKRSMTDLEGGKKKRRGYEEGF